jgi:hypothetical protein
MATRTRIAAWRVQRPARPPPPRRAAHNRGKSAGFLAAINPYRGRDMPAGQAIIQLPAAGCRLCLPFPRKGRWRHSDFAELLAVRYANNWYIHQLSRASMRTDDRLRLLEAKAWELESGGELTCAAR